MVEERSYLAARDRVQADSIRLNRILVHKILTRIIRQSSLVSPPPPTAIHLGPQATWMSLETHPKPAMAGACGILNAKTSRNLACGIGIYSP